MSALDELSMDESKERPNDSSTSFVRSLMTLKRMNEAIAEARTLYESSPLNSESGFLLAESLATNQDEQEAISIVNALDSADPDFSSRIQQLVRLAIDNNLLNLADISLKKARESGSDNTDLTVLDVALSLARRDYKGAELRISTAPNQWKNDDLLMARTRIQMELGLYAEAEAVLGQLSKEAGNSVAASLLRAELYSRFQAYDLAEETLAGGLSQDPANRRLQNTMARMYIAAGKPDLAIGITESFFETDPLNAEGWMLWAVAHTENKSTSEAEMRLAAQQPNSIHFQLHEELLQVVSAYFKAHQHNDPGALTEFELTNFPNDPTRYPAEFGYAYYQCLGTCRSQADAQQFLINITDNVQYSINLTQAAQRQNDFLLAKQILLSIAAEQSGDPGVLDALGQILIRTDGPAAESVFNDMIGMQPTSVPGRHGLALVKWRQRDFGTALALLDSLISDAARYRPGLRDRARLVADWKGAPAAMPEYDKAEQALHNPISNSAERALLSDTELLRSQLGYRSLSVEELFAIRLEKQARFLADWRPDNATATLRRLQQIRPQDSMVAFLLAEQNLRMGRYCQAELSLQELLIQDPENPQIQSAIRYTQKQLQPTLSGEFQFFDQSGRNGLSEISSLRFGPAVSTSIGTGNNILSVGYRHLRLTPPTDYDGLQLIATATQALAGAEANVEAANLAFIGLVPGTPAFQQAVDNVTAARTIRDNAANTLAAADEALVTDTVGNALEVGLHLEPNQNLTVDLDLAAEFYDSGFSSRPLFQLRAVQRVMDGFDAGFSAFLANVAKNSESIRQDIFRYGGGPEFRWQATSRWTLRGRSRLVSYSDKNLLYQFDLNNEVVLYRAPRSLTAVLRFHAERFSEETIRNPLLTNLGGTVHPYFAPSDFAYFTAGLRWKHLLSRLALGENELSYSARCLAQWDNQGVLYGIAGASFDWDATNNLTLSLNFDSINSSEYDAISVFGALIWYLP
jgi:predicted Zn-dependent protease